MVFDRLDQHPGTRFLFVAALVVVVVAGLRAASTILLPMFLAFFLAILTLPMVAWLQKRKVPTLLAIALSVLAEVGVVGFMVLLAMQSLKDLQARLPRYLIRLEELWAGWVAELRHADFPGAELLARELQNRTLFDPSQAMEVAGVAIAKVFAIASMLVLVILIVLFVLSEATVFPAKFRAILGRKASPSSRLAKIVAEVQAYLWIKTVISLATGILLGLWCWIMGLDFPLLLGFIAYVLNYIPTIGSIVASIPAIFLALVQVGLGHAVLVTVGYLAVNTVFGNLLEPNLMGRRLGLSTLVVLLSLMFWGWVWGPLGALLSVPLTMVVKIMLENTPDLRWVAVLLDKSAPTPGEEREAEAEGG